MPTAAESGWRMDRFTRACICIVTVVAIASVALVIVTVAQCQQATNIKRAEQGYDYYGPGSLIHKGTK